MTGTVSKEIVEGSVCEVVSCLVCEVAGCIIKHLQYEWLTQVDQQKEVIHTQAGETIIAEGTRVEGLFIVRKGLVKVLRKGGRGRLTESILRIASTGDIFGERSFEGGISLVSAVAMTECVIVYLERMLLEELFKHNPQFTYEMMRFFAHELYRQELNEYCLRILPYDERVVLAILYLVKKAGIHPDTGQLRASISIRELGALADCAPENVSRVLTKLAHQHLITHTGKRKLAVKDLNKLHSYLSPAGRALLAHM